METQKEKLMRVLKCSEEEAEDIIKTDELIDKGKSSPYDLDATQQKVARSFAKVSRAPTTYNFTKRERKANPTKADLISFLNEKLKEFGDLSNILVENPERVITFGYNDEQFELTLTQKRKKKAP